MDSHPILLMHYMYKTAIPVLYILQHVLPHMDSVLVQLWSFAVVRSISHSPAVKCMCEQAVVERIQTCFSGYSPMYMCENSCIVNTSYYEVVNATVKIVKSLLLPN